MSETDDFKTLSEFLGGDPQARRIARSLIAHSTVRTPEDLRSARGHSYKAWRPVYEFAIGADVPVLRDVQGIGLGSMERIDKALAGEL